MSTWKTRAAVLEERIKAYSRFRHFKNIVITIGTALIGVSIEMYRSSFEKLSIIPGGIGVLMLLLGWIWGDKGDGK